MRERLLVLAARVAVRWPKTVLGVAAALTAVSVALASQLELKLSFVDQLPDDSREKELVDYANENFGGMDLLFVVIRGDDPAQLARAATRVAPRLAELDELVSQILFRIPLSWFRRYGLLYTETEDLIDLADRMESGSESGVALHSLFAAGDLGPLFGAMGRVVEAELVSDETALEDDPADAQELIDALRELVKAAGASSYDATAANSLADFLGGANKAPEGGAWVRAGDDINSSIVDDHVFFFSPDRRALLLLVRPTRQDYNYVFATEFMTAVGRAVSDALEGESGLSYEYTGNLAVMREESDAITLDMSRTTGAALIGILALFLLVFRRPVYLVVVGLPLVMSITWTFGFTMLAFGHFNVVTAIFAPILLGLGIDFAIHLITRYQEERTHARSPADAVTTAVTVAGRGLLTGGLTTSAAFLVMGTARYKGMSQMGIVAGMGILFAMVAMLTVLPAMMAWLGERLPLPPARSAGSGVSEWITRAVLRRPAFVVVVCGLVSVGAVVGAFHISFNYDMRSMEPAGMPSIEAMKRVESEFDMSVDYGLILADDVETERRMVAQLEKLETVGRVDASVVYLPEDQEAKLPAARRLAKTLPRPAEERSTPEEDVEGLRTLARAAQALVQAAVLAGSFEVEDGARALASEATALGERLMEDRPAAFDPLSERLRADRLAMVEGLAEVVEKEGLDVEDLPEAIRATYLGRDGRRLIYAYPSENLWVETFMADHVRELKEVGGADVLGIGIVFHRLISDVMSDFRSASIYSLLAVVFFLFLDFRNPVRVTLALIPLLVGALWMIGVMPALGLSMNYVNIAMIPIVLGVGIDDGVHMLHRFLSERRDGRGVREAIEIMTARTGRAVLLTSVTTIIGFGAVGIAHHRGLASLGHSVAIGIFACYLASVTLLPAMLCLMPGLVARLKD